MIEYSSTLGTSDRAVFYDHAIAELLTSAAGHRILVRTGPYRPVHHPCPPAEHITGHHIAIAAVRPSEACRPSRRPGPAGPCRPTPARSRRDLCTHAAL